MKNFMQKLQDSHLMKNKSKVSSFKKIHHVTLNENEFKTVNDLFIDNDSNDNSSNKFMLTALFTCSVFLIVVFNATAHQDKKQFKNFKRKC